MQKIALGILLLLTTACVVHGLYYYPQLPDVVASHFGAGGRPDAWSSKQVFLTVYLVSVGMTAVIFLGIAFGIPQTADSKLNLPNKEYWLADERRQETMGIITNYFLWFGSATCLLLLDVFHQSFMVHLGKTTTLTHPWLSLGLYMFFCIGWCVGLVFRFIRKQPAA